MKVVRLLVVCVLIGDAAPSARSLHVRPMDDVALSAYALGHGQSGHFRALVAELDASDVIVHVVTTRDMPAGVSGTTRLVGRFGGARYIRIQLAAALTPKMRASILGHELQHACELARSGAATSSAVRRLYQSIGQTDQGWAERFETSDAERAGRIVMAEMGDRRPRPVER